MQRTVTFVGHDASRTGAPILLRSVLKGFVRDPDWDPSVFLVRGGELVPEFRNLAPTSVMVKDSIHYLRLRRLLGQAPPSPTAAVRRAIRHVETPDLAFINTSTLGYYASSFKERGSRVIAYITEVGEFIERVVDRDSLRALRDGADMFIALSRAVAEDFSALADVSPDRVQVVYPGVRSPTALDDGMVARLRQSLDIPEGAVVVGSVGYRAWTKGPDVFLHLARRTLEKAHGSTDFRFIWLGGSDESEYAKFVNYEWRKAGSDHRIMFLPAVEDPTPWLRLFDIFALTSRAEAMGLAMLEAGMMGTPAIVFAGAGGAREFVRDDAGLVVPFLDLEAMSDAVLQLADPSERFPRGRAAAARVRSEFTPERMWQGIHTAVASVMNGPL